MTSRKIIGDSIVKFIENERAIEVDVDTEIFKNRLVNSMFALRLLSFVEKEFEVQLLDDDLSPENFKTPDRLAKLVVLRTSGN